MDKHIRWHSVSMWAIHKLLVVTRVANNRKQQTTNRKRYTLLHSLSNLSFYDDWMVIHLQQAFSDEILLVKQLVRYWLSQHHAVPPSATGELLVFVGCFQSGTLSQTPALEKCCHGLSTIVSLVQMTPLLVYHSEHLPSFVHSTITLWVACVYL